MFIPVLCTKSTDMRFCSCHRFSVISFYIFLYIALYLFRLNRVFIPFLSMPWVLFSTRINFVLFSSHSNTHIHTHTHALKYSFHHCQVQYTNNSCFCILYRYSSRHNTARFILIMCLHIIFFSFAVMLNEIGMHSKPKPPDSQILRLFA